MGEKKEYCIGLDIIRGISCIMVLLYHLNILKGGFLAVCTFFSLSGYLGCMSALKNKNFSVKSYYINKLKKLYFPLIVVVSITVILAKLNSSINWINLKKETTSVIFGYNNFWQLNANLDYFTRNANSPFTHLWYISILLQFDLVFPLIFAFFKKNNKKIPKHISTIVVGLLTIGSTFLFYYMSKTQDIMIVYYNTFARSFSIFWGILLALVHYKYNLKFSQFSKKINSKIFIIYTLLLIILCIFVPAKSEQYALFMILVTIITIRLIEYSTIKGATKRRLNNYIKMLSNISYEIYLVQYPIIFFMQNIATNEILKNIIIIFLTFIISCILNLLMKFPLKRKLFKNIRIAFFSIIILIGSIAVILEKDHTTEMKELELQLSESLKIAEEKNNEYVNETEEKKQKEIEEKTEEVNATLENIDDKKNDINEIISKLPVVGIGDSVLLGTIDELYKKFPNGYFDGKVSRTILKAEEVIKDLKSKGKLSNTLILSLANNGDYSNKINRGLMELLGDREIYWVNAVGADDPNFNEKFKEFASNYDNIHIVEWDKVAKNHSEYFYADGIHVKGNGKKAYVNTIYEAIYNNYLEKNGT